MNDRLPSNAIRPVPAYLPTGSNAAQHSHAFNAMLQGASSNDSEGELREYLKLIIKYKTLIIASFVASVVISALYAFTATPIYRATSKVRIGTYEPVLTATKIEDVLQQKSKEANYLETQLEEMKSFSLADKVLDDHDVQQALKGMQAKTGEVHEGETGASDGMNEGGTYRNSVRAIKSYLNSVEVAPVRRTSIVNINVVAPDPRYASLIANKHAESYIEWVRDNRIEQQARGLKFLRTQADELREKVADIEREMNDYAEINSIVALNKDENITVQKMSQLNQLLTAATAKRIESENYYKEALNGLSSPSAGFDDPTTQTMRTELARLEGEYSELGQKFMPGYPKMRQLKSQIEEIRLSIERQRKQIVTGLKAKAEAIAQEEKRLKDELDSQKSQAFELSKRQVQYNVLNRELTSSRELLQNVLRQIKETSLAVESNASNVSIVDRAMVPTSATFPRKKFIILIGGFIGVCAGIVLALFFSYLDNTVRTPEQLTSLTTLPSLGVVPSFESESKGSSRVPTPNQDLALDGGKSAGTKDEGTVDSLPSLQAAAALPPIAFLSDSRSLVSEAYRTIRTSLLLSQAGEPPRTILVSSAQSSEGKTTSSVNIAVCLASSGGKVAIIDADLRRPSLYKHFGIDPNSRGLVEALTGLASLDEVMQKNLVKRLTIITSGRLPPNPAELLGSLEMATIIDRLASEHDYVIIDSPPILPVTDSVILSRYVDGVVLVVKGGATPRKVVKDAKDRLQSVGARFLGAVLNNVDITSGEYHYYNRYYYSYYKRDGEDEKVKAKAV